MPLLPPANSCNSTKGCAKESKPASESNREDRHTLTTTALLVVVVVVVERTDPRAEEIGPQSEGVL